MILTGGTDMFISMRLKETMASSNLDTPVVLLRCAIKSGNSTATEPLEPYTHLHPALLHPFDMPVASRLCATRSWIIAISESTARVVWNSTLNGLRFLLRRRLQSFGSGQSGLQHFHMRYLG